MKEFKQLCEFTPDEKEDVFGKLHAHCMKLAEQKAEGNDDEDDIHYLFEAVMESFLGKNDGKFWKVYNALGE